MNLSLYRPIAQAIAALLHPHAEVVVHDLATQQVALLVNSFSNRQVGSPSLLEDAEFTDEQQVIGPYAKLNWDGRRLKSISVVLRDDHLIPIGLLCINMDISVYEQTKHLIEQLVGTSVRVESLPEGLFKNDWHEKINVYINQWLQAENKQLAGLNRIEKKQLIAALYHQGAFKGAKAADYIADIMSIGRATVFKYLKELKNQ